MSKITLSTIRVLLVLSYFFANSYMAPVKAPNFEEQKRAAEPKLAIITPSVPYTLVKNGQGTLYEWQNDAITVRLTGAQTQGLFTLTEDVMKPTFNLGLHLHRKHAETFHILDGEVEFRVGSNKHVLQAGTTLHVPSNTPHGVRVINGKQARMLMVYAPAGFDQALAELKTFTDAQFADEEFMKAFNEKYDSIQLE